MLHDLCWETINSSHHDRPGGIGTRTPPHADLFVCGIHRNDHMKNLRGFIGILAYSQAGGGGEIYRHQRRHDDETLLDDDKNGNAENIEYQRQGIPPCVHLLKVSTFVLQAPKFSTTRGTLYSVRSAFFMMSFGSGH